MHLVLQALGIGPGDEVIVTPMTFAASVNVVEHAGATPVFADVEKKGFNISPGEIESVISSSTKAIIPVHFAGLPCDLDSIYEIGKKYNLIVIEDAAHAIGSEYKGRKIGSAGNPTCFSFYVTKNIATAEGGFVATGDEEYAKRIKTLCLHGMDLGAWQRYSKHGNKHYEVVFPGYKYNLTDVASSLGIHQLARLNEFMRIRKEYADMYYGELSGFEELILPRDNRNDKHAWHLYPVMVRHEILGASRDEVMDALTVENIGIGVHFRAVHLHEYYRNKYGYVKGMFPRAEYISDRVFSLPLTPKMTEDDVADVIFALKRIINYFRNRKRRYYDSGYHTSTNRFDAIAGESVAPDSGAINAGINNSKTPVLQKH
jgi:dTDP-4-amino-4,6-dideoxygalactose transaminase